ncbi:MAG TPA: hypothetical protein VEA15_03270 [Caulobacteraceae bacterium]|nr:hypothetical protein [Caulobacteraceae bacterium]
MAQAPRGRASALVNTVATLLADRRLSDAREALLVAPALHPSERVAFEQLALAWREQWAANTYDDPRAELTDVDRVLILRPDDAELRLRRFQVARALGDSRLIAESARAFGGARAGNAQFDTAMSAWNSQVRARLESDPSADVVELGRGLAATGAMQDDLLARLVVALMARPDPWDELTLIARASRSRGPGEHLRPVLGACRDEARSQLAAGDFKGALDRLRFVGLIEPSAEVTAGLLEALRGGAPGDANVADILTESLPHYPELHGVDNIVALRKVVKRLCRQDDIETACAFHEALRLIKGANPGTGELLAASILKSEGFEEHLLTLLRASRAWPVMPLPFQEMIVAWEGQFEEALAATDWPLVWLLGQRLRAAMGAEKGVITALLRATPHLRADPHVVMELWQEFVRLAGPTRRGLDGKTLNALSNAALTELQRDPAQLAAIAPLLVRLGNDTGRARAAIEGLVDLTVQRKNEDDLFASLEAAGLEGTPTALFLRGLLLVEEEQLVAAAAVFRQALAAGLQNNLAALAEAELAAVEFRLVQEGEATDGQALVLVESGAATQMLLATRGLAPGIQVCAPMDLEDAMGEPGEDEGEEDEEADAAASEAVNTVPFRHIDLPEVEAAAADLTRWLVEGILAQRTEGSSEFDVLVTYREDLEREIFLKLYFRLRQVFNLVEAVRTTGLERIFLIWRSPELRGVIERYVRDTWPSRELRIACGAPQRRVRRMMSTVPVPDPDDRTVARRGVSIARWLPKDAGPAILGLPAPTALEDDAERPTALFVITRARPDVEAPLPHLIVTTAKRMRTVVLYIDPLGDAGPFIARLRREPGFTDDIRIEVIDLPQVRLSAEAGLGDDLARALEGMDLSAIPPVFGDVDVRDEISAYLTRLEGPVISARAVDAYLRRRMPHWRPDVALITNTYAMESFVACRVLGEAGTPTQWLQMLQHPRNATFSRPPADRHLVIDRYSADLWHEHVDVAREDIEVVGSLRLDSVVRKVVGLSREAVIGELGLARGTRIVMVATQPVALEENTRLLEITAEAIRDLSDVYVVVKLHPAEGEERIGAYAATLNAVGMPGRHLVTKTHDTYRMIIGADLVVLQHSNVGIEASILDRTVLSIVTGGGRGATFSLADHGFTEEISDPALAIARVRAMLTDPDARAAADRQRRAYLEANPEMRDGRAADRIADHLEAAAYARRGLAPPPRPAAVTPPPPTPEPEPESGRSLRAWLRSAVGFGR